MKTCMFSTVQFSGAQPVDSRGIPKSLWIYRSAKYFLLPEYCPLIEHASFLRLQKVEMHLGQH